MILITVPRKNFKLFWKKTNWGGWSPLIQLSHFIKQSCWTPKTESTEVNLCKHLIKTLFSESTHAHSYKIWQSFDENVGLQEIILRSAECVDRLLTCFKRPRYNLLSIVLAQNRGLFALPYVNVQKCF